jgi:hypothetical protein
MRTTRTPPSSGRTDLRPGTNERGARIRRKRPPKIALVVACSQRKHTPPPTELRLSSINGARDRRIIEWTRRIQKAEAREHRAVDLYGGDHWRAAREAYRLALQYSSRAELWVISAGYGLITSSKLIKPYSATFASTSADSVWRGPQDGDRHLCMQDWWLALPHDATLSELLQGDGTIVVAAGSTYLDALAPSLAAAIQKDRMGECVSVISAGSRGNGALLPVDGRYRRAVGGTDASLNARLLALLASQASAHRFRRSAMTATLVQMAPSLPAVQRRVGKMLTDEQVMRRVHAMRRRRPTCSRTQALRDLRRSGVACEQSRFASIWRLAVAAESRLSCL